MKKSEHNAESIARQVHLRVREVQASYLEEVCGTDVELRQRVERLLESSDETILLTDNPILQQQTDSPEHAQDTRSFLVDAQFHDTDRRSNSGPPAHVKTAEDAVAGKQFGDFELLEQIGVGGMGIVFKARQISLKRLVALKMIKAGEFADAESLERFQKEAQAAATLDHPGIVPAFEVGIHDGQHYFSMGFIDGESLADRLKSGPMPPSEAAELVKSIAQAMDFAHQKGVVHRDLKPGNILITNSGVPRITDFGLAKRIEEDRGLTHTGQILGTPSFMAPEQATGSIDVGLAADVYALGAILYNELTGRPPFQAANIVDTLRQVVEREPIPPRQLNPAVPKDLETICLKCLAKSPDRRYSTAGELADDLGRWLEKKPILARPASRWERGFRWSQRRPAVASLLAVVAVLVTVGFPLVAWQWWRAEKNYLTANENFLESDRQRKRRDVNFKKAVEAVDRLLIRVGAESLANVPGMSPVRRDLLQDALQFYEGFLEEENDDPDLLLESGKAYLRIGQIQNLLQENAAAEESYQEAIGIFGPLAERYRDRPELRQELAFTLGELGRLWFNVGRRDEAETMLRRSVEMSREMLWGNLQNADVQSEVQSELGFTLNTLGLLLFNTQRAGEAETAFREAIDIYESLDGANAASPKSRWRLADCHYKLGELLSNNERRQETETHFQTALELRESLAKEFPIDSAFREGLAISYRTLGQRLIGEGRLEEARSLLNSAVATLEQLVDEFRHVPRYRADLADCCVDTAIICSRAGQTDEVEHFFNRVVSINETLSVDFPDVVKYRRNLGFGYYNLGVLLDNNLRREKSLAIQEKGLRVRRRLASEQPESAGFRSELAISCEAVAYVLPADRSEETLTLLREAIAIGEKLVVESPEISRYKHKLAQSYRTLGERLTDEDPEQAETFFNKALTAFQQLSAQDPTNASYRRFIVFTLDPLGNLQLELGREADAEQSLRTECEVLDQLVTDFEAVVQFRSERAAGRIALGQLLGLVGKPKEASVTLRSALDELEKLCAEMPESSRVENDLLRAHSALARLLSDWMPPADRDLDAALVHAQRAVDGDGEMAEFATTLGLVRYRRNEWDRVLETLEPEEDPMDMLLISMCHRQLENSGEAAIWYDKAMNAIQETALTDIEVQRFQAEAKLLLGRTR